MSIYHQIIAEAKENQATLVAVSKTKPIEDILNLYTKGQRHFGENKVQELKDKYEQLPKDIQWHMIGHLQTNKVKHLISFVSLIHSVDSVNLINEIQKQSLKQNKITSCLLQVHINQEEHKYGFDEIKLNTIIQKYKDNHWSNIKIKGLMGMATFTNNQDEINKEFSSLKCIFDKLKQDYNLKSEFKELSMGMSDDYHLALKHGTTILRIGSKLFGERMYINKL